MRSSPQRGLHSSIPLAVTIPVLGAVLIIGGLTVWSLGAPTAPVTEQRATRVSRSEEDIRITEPAMPRGRKFIPTPETHDPEKRPAELRNKVHSLNRSEENGIKVILIRLVPDGDVLVLDEVTGRLLETRPARPKAEANIAPAGRLPGMRPLLSQVMAESKMADAQTPAPMMR